jgi:penicillin-binding protein 1C
LSAEASARTVALSAVTAADTTTLYWFSGSALLGLTAPAQTLAWGPEPGRHQVRVVDNRGRSDQREINVELLP